MTVDFEEALTLLHSHLKLERDRGLDLLKRNLQDMKQEQQTDDIIVNLRAKILGYIEPSTTSTWEARQGGLLAAKLIVSSKLTDENFVEIVRMRAMALTHDNEARVRQTAGEVLGVLCREIGAIVYEKCRTELLKSVEANLERHIPGDTMSEGQAFTDDAIAVDLGKKNSIQIVHESAGWRHLETSMRCLQHVIEGCGPSFSKYITKELLKLLFQALDHTNRFVRETGYQVFASLVRLGVGKERILFEIYRDLVDTTTEMSGDCGDLELRSDVEDKWQFPKPRFYLGTVLHSGVVRPLSPTLEEHSPERVFPGMAMLAERFETMREWKNTIEFVGFFSTRGNMFDSRHHWDMRTKFLEVRLTCMDRIVEDPSARYRKPEGWFLVRVPRAAQKAMEDEKRTTALACEVHKQRKNSASNMKGKINTKERNYAKSALGIRSERASNVEVKNFAKNELSYNMKENSDKGKNYAQVGIAIEGKNNFGMKNESSFDEKLHCKSLQKGLNVESRRDSETLSSLSAEREHFYSSNDSNMDCLQDLAVVGKAIEFEASLTTELVNTTGNCNLNQDSSSKVDAELVLEDIDDKDFVPD
ncbi:Leishmanolysin-like peptidase, partial [Paramuricea clavata]